MDSSLEVELLYFDGCPHWTLMAERLSAALTLAGSEVTVVRRVVDTQEASERCRFTGSPSVLLDGRDPFPSTPGAFGLTCRMYTTPDGPQGAPTVEQLTEAMKKAAQA